MENKKKKEKKIVVGFWLRFVSDIIDAVILGVFGFILAVPFKGVFYSLGENGLFIGLVITFLYTGILQSHIGKGQSIAKKILRIQVLKVDGSYLSLGRSFFRYTVIALIFYNTWIWIALTSLLPFLNNFFLQSIYTYFIIFLFFGVIVLIAFHPLKRGIHDLLANSIVVRKETFEEEKVEFLNNRSKVNRAFVIWGACCAILVGFSIYMMGQQKDSMSLISELVEIQQKIDETTEFKNISIKHTWHTFKSADGVETKTTSINIFPFLDMKRFENADLKQEEAKKSVEVVVKNYSRLPECDYINVQVRSGFNIGIASFYTRENMKFDTRGNLYEQKGTNFDTGNEVKL